MSVLYIFGISTIAQAEEPNMVTEQIKVEQTPQYLYKILSVDEWEKSKSQASVQLSKEDEPFVHLSKEDQLDRIIEKYWANVSEFVLLKVDTNQLSGRLVYEANPGGTNKYYHLYEGSIPLKAVVDAKIVKR